MRATFSGGALPSDRWFVYGEAGSHQGAVEIEDEALPEAHLTAPKVNTPATVHIILEVKDDGRPSLYSYRRIILEIEP